MSTEHSLNLHLAVTTGPVDATFLRHATAVLMAAESEDGKPPVSEQSIISLRTGGSEQQTVRTVSAYVGEEATLAGFAVVIEDPNEDDSHAGLLELAVHPNYRGMGVARRLIAEVAANRESGLRGLSAWAHASHNTAAELAKEFGFVPVRELWRMRLDAASASSTQSAPLAEGVSIRAFIPGHDEESWLAANRAAFAHHPEQGNMTQADLAERTAEDWFDPAGFLLAVNAENELLGFHWTKVHASTAGQEPLGEVYVVGVTPQAQGMGLGRALTAAGIRYLSQRGIATIMLYVDADNTAAVALYQKLGFTRWDMDVMYRQKAEIQGA
ncbi:mycothiol synthase [Pseudarthrobacter sp. J1738]|uniref:mycothiol synthase n=1 Tax=Pseudarthrobacter sp. J1738 TaxID=3420446 RepID=UPI003D2A60B8